MYNISNDVFCNLQNASKKRFRSLCPSRAKHQPEAPSGFGFELTFRLKREKGEMAPPTWPATLMQALARYVFQSGERLTLSHHNVLCSLKLMTGGGRKI